MDNFIDIETALSGRGIIYDKQYIKELRAKYGRESFVLWQFRRFDEVCNYILENDIEDDRLLSKDAKATLIDRFSAFSKNYS